MKGNQEHTIIALDPPGIFTVMNKISGDRYEIDADGNFCSCKAFKNTRKDKRGCKKPCKHIRMVKGLISEKG